MDRKNLFLVFFATVVALWLLGVSPIIAIAIIVLIGCLGVVAEIAEPDSALKRYSKYYTKIILTMAVAILVTALVSLVFGIPIMKVMIEIITGDVLSGLSVDQIKQLRIMSFVILIFSSLIAYATVYSGSRKMVLLLLVVVFSVAFWQVRMQELPLSQRLTKSIFVTLAKESVQLGTINKEVGKVYLADCNIAEKTFTSITAKDRVLKSGSTVKVKLANPVVMYAEQGFINVLLADDRGEFSLDPNDPGVWLPVEVVTLGVEGQKSHVVLASNNTPIAPLALQSKKVVVRSEPSVVVPVFGPKTIRVNNDWTETEFENQHGSKLHLGPFASLTDVSRLEVKVGNKVLSNLKHLPTDSGPIVELIFNVAGTGVGRQPVELRVNGLPLDVAIQKLN